MAKEDEIRLIAYNIWEEEGCVNGRDCDHWIRAEAIWEQQNQKTAVQNTKPQPKQAVKPGTHVRTTKNRP
jgi:hypothetical protein